MNFVCIVFFLFTLYKEVKKDLSSYIRLKEMKTVDILKESKVSYTAMLELPELLFCHIQLLRWEFEAVVTQCNITVTLSRVTPNLLVFNILYLL